MIPTRVPTHLGLRNAVLVALALPLVFAQCAEEGARFREEATQRTGNDTTTTTAMEDSDSPHE
jgi:hypothetical protein